MPIWDVQTESNRLVLEGEDWLSVAKLAFETLCPAHKRAPAFAVDVDTFGSANVREAFTGLEMRVELRGGPGDWLKSRQSLGTPILVNEDSPYLQCGWHGITAPYGVPASAEGAPRRAAAPQTAAPVVVPTEPPEDLEERLRDLLPKFDNAVDQVDAARIALSVLRELIPAESGAVLVAGPMDAALRFLAVRGPRAESIERSGMEVPLGRGIAGFVFKQGASLLVREAEGDARFHKEVDQSTGYHTSSILAVPITEGPGVPRWGVLELLNAEGGFQPWHIEVAEMVATVLAEAFVTAEERAADAPWA
jgi:hypothetical protein